MKEVNRNIFYFVLWQPQFWIRALVRGAKCKGVLFVTKFNFVPQNWNKISTKFNFVRQNWNKISFVLGIWFCPTKFNFVQLSSILSNKIQFCPTKSYPQTKLISFNFVFFFSILWQNSILSRQNWNLSILYTKFNFVSFCFQFCDKIQFCQTKLKFVHKIQFCLFFQFCSLCACSSFIWDCCDCNSCSHWSL